jgi:hypothetical protein
MRIESAPMRRLLIIACLLGTTPVARAQTDRGAWESLNGLRAGQRIEVVETNLKKHTGTFVTVSDEAIQLREGPTDESVKKADVMRVTLLEKNHRLRNALIGGAVGCGAGAGIGAVVHSGLGSFFSRSAAAGFGAVIGLAAGAALGAAVPSHPTIYRANPPH